MHERDHILLWITQGALHLDNECIFNCSVYSHLSFNMQMSRTDFFAIIGVKKGSWLKSEGSVFEDLMIFLILPLYNTSLCIL